jgi:hypothetical protein
MVVLLKVTRATLMSVCAIMDDVIRTGITVKSGGSVYCLDNPAHRQRYARYLKPRQKEKFAKDYLGEILKAEEYTRWYMKMLKQ